MGGRATRRRWRCEDESIVIFYKRKTRLSIVSKYKYVAIAVTCLISKLDNHKYKRMKNRSELIGSFMRLRWTFYDFTPAKGYEFKNVIISGNKHRQQSYNDRKSGIIGTFSDLFKLRR